MNLGSSMLRFLRRQDGIALVMAVGMLAVLTIMATTALYYTSTNTRSASRSDATEEAYALAEAGMAQALSVLHNAFDPRTATAVPSTTITLEGGTATYSGTLSGDVWTLSSTGKVTNPTGPDTADATRTLTRAVQIYGINAGATLTAWSRIYSDDTACLTVPVSIPAPVSSRGGLCLTGSGKIVASTVASNPTKVSSGGNVTLATGTSIGVAGTNVAQVDVSGTCSYNAGTAHKPCEGPPANADKVYATTITTNPTDLAKPTVDFAYWYTNAKPGPNQNCTTGSFPGGFDTNTTYDKSRSVAEITPTGSSYTCQVSISGNLVGELSWNRTTKVLKIKGTVFIDGPIQFVDAGQLVNYQGRGVLYASGRLDLLDEKICAGGTGTTDCTTAGMTSWDPTQNMLVLIAGGDENAGISMDVEDAAFQGVIHYKNSCKIKGTMKTSGPLVCKAFTIDPTTAFYSWPPVGSLLPGQTYGSTSTSTDFVLSVGNQSG